MPAPFCFHPFYAEVPVDNTQEDVLEEIKIVATRAGAGPQGENILSEENGELFLPQDPESFQYDADGNLTRDGQWDYVWDGDNRLISMETRDDLSSALQRKKLDFTYDYRSRRVLKADQNGDGTAGRLSHLDSHAALAQSRPAKRGNLEGDSPKGGNGSGWVQVEDLRFIYDGWNLVAELNDQSEPVRTHVWGTDLSGSAQGAGGVGGLLWTEVHESTGSELYYMAYDGNGNVMGAVSESDGTLSAAFEYSPFGVLLVVEGESADDLPIRFSTKYEDADTGDLYYGYRFLNPETGRWLNRDPIGERGGVNLYGFVANRVANRVDLLSLTESEEHVWYESARDAAHAAGVAAILEEWNISLEVIKKRHRKKDPEPTAPTHHPREHGGRVCCKNGTSYTTTAIEPSEQRQIWGIRMRSPSCPEGSVQVAWWHTHPGDFDSLGRQFTRGGWFSGFRFGSDKPGDSEIADGPDGFPVGMTRPTIVTRISKEGELKNEPTFETKFLLKGGEVKDDITADDVMPKFPEETQ